MTPEERARDIARLVESHFYLTSESDEFKAAVANAIREAVREEKVRAARITQKMGRDFANEGEDYVASICASLTSAILNETPEPAKAGNTAGEPLEGSTGPDVRG